MLLDERVIEGLETLIEKYKAEKRRFIPKARASVMNSISNGGDQEPADPSYVHFQ